MGNIYGYIRISSTEQNERRQIMALEQYPLPMTGIYMDKMSGKDFHRPQYTGPCSADSGPETSYA